MAEHTETTTSCPPITIEQYLRFKCPEGYRDELINGRIIVSPRPTPIHRQIVENTMEALDRALQQQPYGAHQHVSVQFAQAYSMPAPDVIVIPDDTWKQACRDDKHLDCVPLLVVEVVSCANCKEHVEEKIAIYLNEGVHEIWIIEPRTGEFELLTPKGRSMVNSKEQNGGVLRLAQPLAGAVAVCEIFDLHPEC
jgi:Uma2 family endonuclease